MKTSYKNIKLRIYHTYCDECSFGDYGFLILKDKVADLVKLKIRESVEEYMVNRVDSIYMPSHVSLNDCLIDDVEGDV